MCDHIPHIMSVLHEQQVEATHLTDLLKKCKEMPRKQYKCYLIADQLTNKQNTVKALQERLEIQTQLCELYQYLEKNSEE